MNYLTIEEIREELTVHVTPECGQQIIDSIVKIRTNAYAEGWADSQNEGDALAINQLVDFVRTPEWSVSMLKDIAEIVQKARPESFVGDYEYGADDPRAWKSH